MAKNFTQVFLTKISINFQAKGFGETSVAVVVVPSFVLVVLVMVNIIILRMFTVLYYKQEMRQI
jgi:hypothetical protein